MGRLGLGRREQGGMYCEWDAYMGRLTRLGHEKETVCIVSGGEAYVGRSTRLGHENETVCILIGGGVCGEIGVGSQRTRWYVL